MKAALILLCLAVCVVAIYAIPTCNPDGQGIPDCSTTTEKIHRNNWDPTRYFVCNGNIPETVLCPTNHGFDPVSKTCVNWAVWEWYPVCP